jgi:hypothetical protein
VKPLVIKLRDGAEPVRMSARKYAPPQLKFMRDKIRELEELGLVKKEHWSRVGESSAHPSEARARPVSHDCRSACTNASTKPTAWLMPNLQDELHDLHGSEVFATLDFFSRLLADTCAQMFSRLSIFHHAGWSVHTDTFTTWNEECDA